MWLKALSFAILENVDFFEIYKENEADLYRGVFFINRRAEYRIVADRSAFVKHLKPRSRLSYIRLVLKWCSSRLEDRETKMYLTFSM